MKSDINNIGITTTENGFLVRVASKDAEWFYCANDKEELFSYVSLLFDEVAQLPKIEPPKPPMPPSAPKLDRIRLG